MNQIGKGLATCGIWAAVAYMVGSGNIKNIDLTVFFAAGATILLWIFG